MTYKYYIWDASDSKYAVWSLKHVEHKSFTLKKTSQAYGVPNRSTGAIQVFETQGPVMTIRITGMRMNWEEDVPNWDFIFGKDIVKNNNVYKGLDWYDARIQCTRPLKLRIEWEGDNDPHDIPTGTWKVAMTRLNFTMNSSTAGMMEYSIDLTVRR